MEIVENVQQSAFEGEERAGQIELRRSKRLRAEPKTFTYDTVGGNPILRGKK